MALDPRQSTMTGPPRGLLVWCVSTFVAIAALPLYLPLSLVASLGPLDAQPWPLTLVVLAAAATSAWVALRGRRHLPGALRDLMVSGAVMAILGAGGWVGYVEVLSGTLAPDRAPELGAQAPTFEVTDPEGRTFSLGRALEAGPVLLVFYRAHW
jgi:hypothetical protein